MPYPRSLLREFEQAAPVHRHVPLSNDVLRRRARHRYLRAHPRIAQNPRLRTTLQVHHRVPLEWKRLFPQADPNRLSNLQGLTSRDHARKASDLWDAFRAAYRRRGRRPTPADVLRYAMLVDRSLNLPYPL